MAEQNLKQKPGKRVDHSSSARNSANGKFANTAKTPTRTPVRGTKPQKKRTSTDLDRYEMRIDSTRRANWERAKALAGFSTLKDYLTHLADQDSEKVIEKYDTMTLKNNVFDMFVESCEASSKPNDKLLAAAKQAKEQGF